jgi:hypothetical protein
LPNFGAFATPEQNILFDINHFDETLGRRFYGRSQAPSSERRGCRFGSQPFKKASTGDRGDYCRSLSHPSAQLGKAFPVGNLAQQGQRRCSKVSLEVAVERSLFLLCFAYNGSIEVAGGMVSHHFPLQA